MLDENYVEALAQWRAGAGESSFTSWLEDRGLGWRPMVHGLLVWGTLRAFEQAFGIDLEGVLPPVEIPVPKEIQDSIESIAIPVPPQIIP